MLSRAKVKWVLTAVAVAALAGSADAQPASSNPPPPATATAGGGGDAQVGFQRRTQLSPQEQVVEAERTLSRMEQAAVGIRHQLEQARQQRDVVKTLCLNDKLSQIDVAIRSAKDRNSALKAAAGRNDQELSNHEFTIITVLRQRAEQLSAEANQCIGEEAAFVGDTKITMSVDPTLPGDDTTQYPPEEPGFVSEPPRCVSCER